MSARQTTLFDILPHNGKDTSKAAAKVAFRKSWYFREKIHAFLIARGVKGATRFEIEEALRPTLGIKGDTIRPRILELIARGMVEETPEMRRTVSGCNAKVLVAK